MAKRRRVNRRMVILLAAFGVILLAGALVWGIRPLPKDPTVLAASARRAAEEENFEGADRAYRDAIAAARDQGQDVAQYWYELGQLHLDWLQQPNLTQTERAAHFRQGRRALQTAVERDPKQLEAREALADISFGIAARPGASATDMKNYIDQATALLELKPQDDQTYMRRALIRAKLFEGLGGESNFEDALADFQKAVELNPTDPEYWARMIVFLSQHRSALAPDVYARAVENNPESAVLRITYAEQLYRRGRKQAAIDLCLEAIEVAPEDPTGHLALAALYMRDREYEQAKTQLQAAKDVDPSYQRIYRDLARIYISEGQQDQAIETLEQGLDILAESAAAEGLSLAEQSRINTGRLELNDMLADRLLSRIAGMEPGRQRQEILARAEQVLERISQLEPGGIRETRIRARLAYAKGDLEEAAELFEVVMDRTGGMDLRSVSTLMAVYRERNMPGRAERLLDQLLERPEFRGRVEPLLMKAQYAMSYRDFSEAMEYVGRALEIDATHVGAQHLKTTLMAAMNQIDNLPEDYEPSPGAVNMLVERAMTLWSTGKRDEAVAMLEDLHGKSPDDMNVLMRLLVMYQSLGRQGDANDLLDDALTRHPDSTRLKLEKRLLNETDPEERLKLRLNVAETQISDPAEREMEKAFIYKVYGKEDKFVESLRRAMQESPELQRPVMQLFAYAISEKEWELAEQLAARAAQYDLDDQNGRFYAANLAMARKNWDEAIKNYLAILEQRPEWKNPRALLGSAYLAKADFANAANAFQTVLADDPTYVTALIGMAKIAEQRNEREKHREYVERAHRLPAGRANEYIAERYLRLQEAAGGDVDELIRQRERRLQRNPGDIQNAIRLAALYERDGSLQNAEHIYRRMYEGLDNKLAAADMLVGFLNRHGRSDEATRILEDLIENEQFRSGAYVLYGRQVAGENPEQAKRAFRSAIESDPDNSLAYEALATMLTREQKWDAAADALKEYLRLRPDSVMMRKRLVRLLTAGQKYDEAAELADELIAADSSDAESLVLRGSIAADRGNTERALNLYSRAIQVDPRYAEAMVRRGTLYVAQGDLESARRDLLAAKDLSNNPEVSMMLVRVYIGMNRVDDAERLLREVIANNPQYPQAYRQLINLYARQEKWPQLEGLLATASERFADDPAYARIEADMWRRRGDYLEAMQASKRAVEIRPDSTPLQVAYLSDVLQAGLAERVLAESEQLASDPVVLAIRGAALAKLERADQAEQAFLEALRQADAGQLGPIVRHMIMGYGRPQAVENLEKWSSTRPDDWRLHLYRGSLYRTTGRQEEAVQAYRKALSLADEPQARAAINQELALTHYRLGQYDQAEQAYLAVLQDAPDNAMVMNNVAYMYATEMDRAQDALPYAERAVALLPNDANVLDTYGWVLAQMGRYDEARQALLKAIQMQDPLAAMRYHLGWVYEQQGLTTDALRHYRLGLRKADQADPVHELLTEAIERLQSGNETQ